MGTAFGNGAARLNQLERARSRPWGLLSVGFSATGQEIIHNGHRTRGSENAERASEVTGNGAEPRRSPEPGCSRDQKQPGPDGDGPDGSGDALTGRCESLDGDGGRPDSHPRQLHAAEA